MSQQINLYDPSLRPTRELLTLNNLALACAAVLVVLAVLTTIGVWREKQEFERFQAAEQALREAQEQLTELATQQGARHIDPALEQALADAQRVAADKREILSLLDRGDLGERKGFFVFLEGLARRGVDGLWLTGFDLDAGGRNLELRGRMMKEALLPDYVRALRQEAVFQGREFLTLDLRRIDPARASAAEAAAANGSPPVPMYLEFLMSGRPQAAAGK